MSSLINIDRYDNQEMNMIWIWSFFVFIFRLNIDQYGIHDGDEEAVVEDVISCLNDAGTDKDAILACKNNGNNEGGVVVGALSGWLEGSLWAGPLG